MHGTYDKPSPAQVALLERVRTRKERHTAARLLQGFCCALVRMGNQPELEPLTSNTNAELILQATGCTDTSLVLNGSSFDASDDWDRIFEHFPEILDSYRAPCSAEDAKSRLLEAKEEALAGLEPADEDQDHDSVDGNPLLASLVQHAAVSGVLWVQDREASREGSLMLVWCDDRGRVVRKTRMMLAEVQEISGLLMQRQEIESSWWDDANVGEEYGDDWLLAV